MYRHFAEVGKYGSNISFALYDCARVVIGLKGGTLTKIEETGETSNLNFDTGVAYWLAEDPPGTLHADINESEEPIEVMVIELKALDTSQSS